MLNSIFYTFSTIAQTLGGAIGLLGAFVLFRLQSLNAEIDNDAYIISLPLEQMSCAQATTLYRDGKFRELLEMAPQIQPGMNQALRERTRLPILLERRESLIHLLRQALYLTLGLIVFSIVALVVAGCIAAYTWTTISVFTIGILWLLACVRSYIRLMLETLK